MKYDVVNFKIDSSAELLQIAKDLIADAAGEAGCEAFEDAENGIKGYVEQGRLNRLMLDEALHDLPLSDVKVSYSLEEAEYKDWNNAWEEAGFEPINVDNKVIVYDARQSLQDIPAGILPVFIQAQQAFGTGTHQTTQMIISALLSLQLHGKRVLDCGCGTGILGIVASKLGVDDVIAYDIDEWSVENTRHNAQINQVDNLQVMQGNASVIGHISGVFDVVVANINRNILLNDMPMFKKVMSANGILILSGFYAADIPLLEEKATSVGLSLIEVKNKDEWRACIFRLKNQ